MIKLNQIAWILVIMASVACSERNKMNTLYDINVDTINGKSILMDEYKGKTILIVNTASRCGFTGQYEGLQTIYDKYKDQGLVVLAFPSNNFMGQEPGSNESIANFCSTRFNITFPIFAKIDVKGKNQHPLFKWLTSKETNPSFNGALTWNFNKFLISPEGEIINRFGSRTTPKNNKIIVAIEQSLAKTALHN